GTTIYVSHRDVQENGVITALGYDGSHRTVQGDLPAQGDFGVSDIAISPTTGRLWFGVGSATNSGVVGLDNWYWAKRHGRFCDRSAVMLKLNGYHFMSNNPDWGLLGGSDLAVTGPFQPFGKSTKSIIPRAPVNRSTGAVFSV